MKLSSDCGLNGVSDGSAGEAIDGEPTLNEGNSGFEGAGENVKKDPNEPDGVEGAAASKTDRASDVAVGVLAHRP